MNILGLSQKNSGCGYHRVVLPLGFMDGIKGYVTNLPSDEIVSEYNYLLYNRISVFDNNIQVLKDKGYKIIIDLDDDWDLPANHLLYDDYVVFKKRIEENILNADLVTCTNERIWNKIVKINKRAEIIPNALPYGLDQFTDNVEESEFIRLFWCGSITHEQDLQILHNPLKRLIGTKVQMVIGGFNPSNNRSKQIWEQMWKHFTCSGKLESLILPSQDPTEYMKLYSHADICLIPLENSSWHSAKSNLKILEAATKKLPVIVSKVEPYSLDKDAPVLWVEKQSDWFKHINYLINNKNARIDYGEALYNWAKEKYNFHRINAGRKQCFESI